MGTKWCVHATEDNMKTLIMCVIVLFAVSQAAPFASETDDFADNFAVEEYEFEQEAKTSLIDDGWKTKKYGDKQYAHGSKAFKKGMKIADSPRMGVYKKSMKKITKATRHFEEAKARYLTKKGCHRVKQCKIRPCSKKEMLLEKKKKALVQTSYYSHQQGQLHCKKNRWGSIDQRQCRYKHGKDKRHCEVDLQACNSLVYCEHNRDMCRSDCARCGRPSCSRYSSYSRGGSCTSICDRERESCDSTHKHHRDHQHWEINHYHRSTGGGCQRRYSWEPCRSVGSEMLLEKKKKKKSAKKGKKKKGKKKKGKKKKHGAWHVRGEEPHPWIRHVPCGKKVCRFVTKCDMKKVKMYERKQKKEEAAIAKKYEAMDWKRRVAWKKNAPERKAKAKALKKKGKKKKGKKGKKKKGKKKKKSKKG